MDMGILVAAIAEANRFIAAARTAQQRFDADWERDSAGLNMYDKVSYANISKENAACRRASLDLTRILARLRNR